MGKQNKKHKSGKRSHSKKPSAPVSVPQRKVVSLDTILERIYSKEDLSTTCLRQCTCCRVACPQMKFSEATSIIDHIWSTWSDADKRALLATCMEYFFSDSLIKPCPILDGKTCREYQRRPLNCRLYGLWPEKSWEDRVAMFSKSTGLPREKLPLNIQCTNVRRKAQTCKECNGDGQVTLSKENPLLMGTKACSTCAGLGKFQPPPLTSEQISAMFESLDKADMILGVTELKVSTSWNYRTLHDWVLLKFWGESELTKLTNILLTTSSESKQALIAVFKEQVSKIVFKKEKR